jgi:predicted NUDIX family NTP pyrophosphohydrolase
MEESSGIIIYRKNNEGIMEYFMCTPYMPRRLPREIWNFPKGHIEEGKTPLEAALREFEEETSVKLSALEEYHFEGKIRQNFKKIVYVFSKPYNGEDFSNLSSNICTTMVLGEIVHHHEVKDYAWMTLAELQDKGLKCYLPILTRIEENVGNN